jgi:hypothetical protein
MAQAIKTLETALPDRFTVSIVCRSPDDPRAHLLMGRDAPEVVSSTMAEIRGNPGHRQHAADLDGIVRHGRKH